MCIRDRLAAARRFGAEPEAVRTANPGLDANLRRAASGITVPRPFEAVPKISWSTQANEHSIRALSSRYPSLMPGTWGRSAMGKRLRSLTFGDGNRTLVFTAAHHANEWITAPALLRYAGALASRYHAGDGAAVEAHRQLRVYFLPLVDPDGVDLVTGAIGEGPWLARARQIAADYPQVAWPDGWKANIRGTDLNLQYPCLLYTSTIIPLITHERKEKHETHGLLRKAGRAGGPAHPGALARDRA